MNEESKQGKSSRWFKVTGTTGGEVRKHGKNGGKYYYYL